MGLSSQFTYPSRNQAGTFVPVPHRGNNQELTVQFGMDLYAEGVSQLQPKVGAQR
jgi:hypothetical protein